MDFGATERELEKRLQDPTAEPMSLPLEFLEFITCTFSSEKREVGRGAYGVVYKGVLQSGKIIAIKKIYDKHLLDMDNNNQSHNEITCVTGVRHRNVVRLVGYCVQTKFDVMEVSGKHVLVEKPACLLCFEFLSNGSLDEHLSGDTSVLDWDKRYKIIRGVCRGLHYLHDKHHIVHRDLKPQNILMDDTMVPKIADFGLSRLLGQEKSRTKTAKLQGTPGYMAPECIEQRVISFEADIFSLGVIIIEIITGSRSYPKTDERTETSLLKLYADEVVGSWRNRTPMHMLPEMHIQQMEQCVSIALKCLEPDSKKRPTSLDIVKELDALDPEFESVGNSPSDPDKDRGRNKSLQSQVNMNIISIPVTPRVFSGLNECTNLFQWVTSLMSSQCKGRQKQKLQGDVRQLQRDLQCLSDTLPTTYNLIDRAEWRIHDPYVAVLLTKLKGAVYDAEDLIDEFRWYETLVSVEGNVISVEPIIKFFESVTQGSFNTVTDIQKRLDNISGQLEKTGLLHAIPRFDKSLRPETSSFPTEAKIFGRDKEKKKLISLLGVPTNNRTGRSRCKRKRSGVGSSGSSQVRATIDSHEAARTPEVLPIVGIGGVGKTTLAQDIYNNLNVKRHFDLIIWICVSDDFDVKRLTKEAIEQSSGEVPRIDNLDSLQRALANSLNSRRFLIILDDMWDENKQHWERFYAPFRDVLQGSMMLVTTRSPKVADIVHTMDPFPLEGLDEDAFRGFFQLCVFGSDSSNNYPELDRIGEEILPKLKGSPLAAKTLGRLLGMSLVPAHWDRILKSQLWELSQKETDILPALRLSYMYLPFYLKRCFSFCAVYPKDYNFTKKELAEIWAAEGLVKHEHTGDQYFEELTHLSFFQKFPRSKEKYVIHDLMHDMAQLVSKDECFIIKDTKDIANIPENVRHLLVLKGGDVKCSDLLNLCKHTKLRTLLCNISLKSTTGNSVMKKLCAELLCMRVMVCLSISYSGLPGSISNMKHLRYLKILDPCTHKSLPAEFTRLYNLQLFYANKWEINDIPSGFVGMLINLQKFESDKFKIHDKDSVDSRGGATDEGPRREATFLRYQGKSLPSFFQKEDVERIPCHGIFSSLTDVQIEKCQGLSSVEQFLQPAYMPNIKKIKIGHCNNLERVPTEKFGGFSCLEALHVSHCPKIKSQCLFAPSLKELFLTYSGDLAANIECCSLTTCIIQVYPAESIELNMWSLPSLQRLEISSCHSLTIIRDDSEPSLSTDPFTRSRMGKFPLLTHLDINFCKKLETIDDLLCLPAIESIEIRSCGLQSLPANIFGGSPRLKYLDITWCPSLNWQSGMLLPSSLLKLKLMDCGDLSASFPSCLGNLTSLESLEIHDCESIVSVPGHMWRSNLKSLTRLVFYNCPRLESIGGPDATAHISSLAIDRCPELKEFNQPFSRGSIF